MAEGRNVSSPEVPVRLPLSSDKAWPGFCLVKRRETALNLCVFEEFQEAEEGQKSIAILELDTALSVKKEPLVIDSSTLLLNEPPLGTVISTFGEVELQFANESGNFA